MGSKIVITAPSLDPDVNISGISAVTQFIINNNPDNEYIHFELGKQDAEKRDLRWLFRIVKTYLKWQDLLLSHKISLVHFNVSLDKRSLIRDSPLIWLARLLNVRTIFHIHGGEALTNPKNPAWVKFLIRVNFSCRNPKIVLGEAEKETLGKLSGSDKIFILPNCIELIAASKFERMFDDSKPLTLLFMGRIVIAKGIEYIYQALKSLKEKGIKFKFIMAGKGPDENIVQKFDELLVDNFEFKGVISGDKKDDILRDSDVFLLPSFFEGLPVALLEGMSFGLVPVTTDVGSIKYVVHDNDNGIIIHKQSSDDIVHAVEQLANDRQHMHELSSHARDYIFENYNSSKYVSALNEIYNYE